MPYVPVVMLVAAAVVLVGVIVVALGRGGELAYFQPDYAPLRLDEVTATDVVLFRPNFSLWGYNVPATDEALNRIADALTERDIEINALRRQVESLRESPLRLFRDEPGREPPPDRSGPLSSPAGSSSSSPSSPGASAPSRDVQDDEGLGRLLSRARGEPSGLGWTDPPGPLRFPDDQLSGTTPTGSGFPGSPPSGFPGSGSGFPGSPPSGFPGSPPSGSPGSPPSGSPGSPPSGSPPSGVPPSGPAGAHPWSPASRPPVGRPPWPPAAKPPPSEEPSNAGPAFRHTTEFPRKRPSRGPSVSSPSPAPSSATDDPPDFPGRAPRPPRPPRPPQENGR